MTKKKEAARSANAHATGGGPPLVCNLRPLRVDSKYTMFNYFQIDSEIAFINSELWPLGHCA
jgi:hypothetical protein